MEEQGERRQDSGSHEGGELTGIGSAHRAHILRRVKLVRFNKIQRYNKA